MIGFFEKPPGVEKQQKRLTSGCSICKTILHFVKTYKTLLKKPIEKTYQKAFSVLAPHFFICTCLICDTFDAKQFLKLGEMTLDFKIRREWVGLFPYVFQGEI